MSEQPPKTRKSSTGRPSEVEWRFVKNVRPRPWSVHRRHEVHDLENELEACELDEDFGFGNLEFLHIENTLEALTDWLDDNTDYNPCPVCLDLPEDYNVIMRSDDHRVVFHVDRKRLVHLLLDMVAIPSVTFEEGPLATYLADIMEEIGLEVELQRVGVPAGSGLKGQQPIARWKGTEDGPTVLLVSHMDHHPPVDGWDRPPFQGQVEAGWVYGCGTQDGKGGIATMVMAVMALKQSGFIPKGSVVIAPVMGHKHASLGIRSLLETGLQADWVIDVKNTDVDIVTAGVGVVQGRIAVERQVVPFRSLDGTNSWPANPITQMADIIQAMGHSQTSSASGGWLNFLPYAELPGFPQWTIDAIEGNKQGCNLDFHICTVPGLDEETVRNDLERLLHQMGTAGSGLSMEVRVPSYEDATIPPFVGSKNTRLIRTLKKWHKCIIRQKPVVGAGAFLGEVADGHWTAHAGSSTVLYGPGNLRAFGQWPTANERIWIEDMVMAASVIALVIRDLLS